ncbi:MAG: murein hydrolase activator EnvC family protein [Myxococcota bacterium]
MRKAWLVPILIALVISNAALPASAAGPWSWPVSGPVINGFDPPASPFGSGHRGIDIAAAAGTPVLAPAPGTITFAGPVAGHLFVTIDHGGGVESTYSWVSAIVVKKGDAVVAGTLIARSGTGHPSDVVPSLHMGVKLHDVYVDPLAYLSPMSVSGFIRLAPLLVA